MSCGLTLSSRMRIAVQREIRELEATGQDPERAARLRQQYKYYGDQTCATDGLCSTSCPMKINTGELTHLIRQLDMNKNPMGYKVGEFAANHMAGIKSGLRVVLDVAHFAHITLGPTLMTHICRTMNKMGMPLWTTAMPKKKRQPKKSDLTQFIINSIDHSTLNIDHSAAQKEPPANNGQRSMVNGQSSMVNGQRSMVNGQRPPDDGTLEGGTREARPRR